jgi:hypothetical protein
VGATPQSYGDATTDTSGSFALSFTMPAQWPDGTPITETDLLVVVLNQDGSTKASAPFEYFASTSDPLTVAPDQIGDEDRVVLTWRRDGGTAETCEEGIVHWSGRVETTACEGVRKGELGRLSEDAIVRLRAWTEAYRELEFEQHSAAAKDGKVQVVLVGSGPRHATEIEKRAIQELLATLTSQ